MLKDRIKDLTEQLKRLHIEQDRLREQERKLIQAIVDSHRDLEAQQETPSSGAAPSRKDEDRKPRSKPTGSAKQPAKSPREDVTIGARVRIKNPKPYPGANILLETDKEGIVTRKSKFFIFVRTNNPRATQDIRRSRSNIEILP